MPQGQGQFKLQEPEAAAVEGWTDQSLQNPQVVCAFLCLADQEGLVGSGAAAAVAAGRGGGG